MQAPGSDNAGPGRDIFGLELMSEGKETLLEKMKANGTIFELNSMLSQIFISEWTLSLMVNGSTRPSFFDFQQYHDIFYIKFS